MHIGFSVSIFPIWPNFCKDRKDSLAQLDVSADTLETTQQF